MNYREKEMLCESAFAVGGPYWHLYTDGNQQSLLFADRQDMKVGMNLFAVSVVSHSMKVYTFELMNNHVHVIFAGPQETGMEMFESFKIKLQRYFRKQKRVVDLSSFSCTLFRIETLQSLRNEIVYSNRNGYLVRPDCTPYSYPWGANASFFNPMVRCLTSIPYNSLTVREKRLLCHSNKVDLNNGNLQVFEGLILPSSYCYISEAESFYRDAHHYFHLLTKNFEAYSEIAGRMHESLVLTDEEMYAAVSALCLKNYNVRQPSLLSGKDKVELARRMHSDYNASNRQIRSILKIAQEYVDELFPQSRTNMAK